MRTPEVITIKHTGQQGSHLRNVILWAGLEGEVHHARLSTTMTPRQACDLLAAIEAHQGRDADWSPAYRNVVKKLSMAVANG